DALHYSALEVVHGGVTRRRPRLRLRLRIGRLRGPSRLYGRRSGLGVQRAESSSRLANALRLLAPEGSGPEGAFGGSWAGFSGLGAGRTTGILWFVVRGARGVSRAYTHGRGNRKMRRASRPGTGALPVVPGETQRSSVSEGGHWACVLFRIERVHIPRVSRRVGTHRKVPHSVPGGDAAQVSRYGYLRRRRRGDSSTIARIRTFSLSPLFLTKYGWYVS
ncbi:hypothetical protein SK128_023342, partial [Halocaridina rubra]